MLSILEDSDSDETEGIKINTNYGLKFLWKLKLTFAFADFSIENMIDKSNAEYHMKINSNGIPSGPDQSTKYYSGNMGSLLAQSKTKETECKFFVFLSLIFNSNSCVEKHFSYLVKFYIISLY